MTAGKAVTLDLDLVRDSIASLLEQASGALGRQVSGEDTLFWKVADDCVHDIERAPELTVGDVARDLDLLALPANTGIDRQRLWAAAHVLVYIAEQWDRR